MKTIRIIASMALLFVAVGCSTLSTGLPTITTEQPGPIELKTEYDRLTIASKWQSGMPLGPGRFDWYIRYPSGEKLYSSCNATFYAPDSAAAIQPQTSISNLRSARDAYKYEGKLYGNGEIKGGDGNILYKGQLSIETKKAEGCKPEGSGVFFREDGWRVSSVFIDLGGGFRFIQSYGASHSPSDAPTSMRQSIIAGAERSALCSIVDKNNRERWKGGCSNYRIKNGLASKEPIDQFSPLSLARGRGTLWTEEGEKIDLEIDAITRTPKDGPARLTSPDGTAWKVLFRGQQIVARHLASESITSKAVKGCTPWQGFTAVEGRCTAGRWNGLTQAYSADGERRISGVFANGAPQGDLEYSELSTGVRIRGQAATAGNSFGFTQGRIYQSGSLAYEGQFSGVQPNGHGTCMYQGSPESCDYYDGARVDALYKTRQENERMQQAVEKARQQQAKQQEAQASAQPAKDSNWGLKAMVIGGTALIAGNSGIPIDKQVEVVSNVSSDVLSDGKTSNTSQALSRQQQQLASKSSGASSTGSATSQAASVYQNFHYTYSCGDGNKSQDIAYKSQQCLNAKKFWYSTYACNDVSNMDKATAGCVSGCGNRMCDEK